MLDHVVPPSKETVAPPSFASIMRRESLRSIHSVWQSPCGTRMRENVLPPSTERQVPRLRTYTMFSFAGSAVMKEKYHGRIMNFCSALTRSHVVPASSERKMPPVESGASTLAHKRAAFAGDTVMPMRPSGRGGKPRLPVMAVQVSPPSVLFHNPLEPPPAENPHGKRCAFHSAAYSTRGFAGSRAKSMAPVASSTNSTFAHVLPPSLERNTPRVGFRPKAWPMAATYTTSGFVGSTRTTAMWRVSSRPRCRHVSPPSVERHMPSP